MSWYVARYENACDIVVLRGTILHFVKLNRTISEKKCIVSMRKIFFVASFFSERRTSPRRVVAE